MKAHSARVELFARFTIGVRYGPRPGQEAGRPSHPVPRLRRDSTPGDGDAHDADGRPGIRGARRQVVGHGESGWRARARAAGGKGTPRSAPRLHAARGRGRRLLRSCRPRGRRSGPPWWCWGRTDETHLVGVLAGERVYKVQKPVNLGFLDFRTLRQRRHFCQEEVRLNRGLAPDTYLGVVALKGSRPRIQIGGLGPTVEVAVEMRRLPAERMLERLVVAGRAEPAHVRAVAATVARFHGEAETGGRIDQMGSVETIRKNWDECFTQTAETPADLWPSEERQALRDYVDDFLTREASRPPGWRPGSPKAGSVTATATCRRSTFVASSRSRSSIALSSMSASVSGTRPGRSPSSRWTCSGWAPRSWPSSSPTRT